MESSLELQATAHPRTRVVAVAVQVNLFRVVTVAKVVTVVAELSILPTQYHSIQYHLLAQD